MNILVTGGSKGLGRMIVESLRKCEHNVYYTYNKTYSICEDNLFPIKVDFCDDLSCTDFYNNLKNLQIDVVVNNYFNSPNLLHAHKTNCSVLLSDIKANIFPNIEITKIIIDKFRRKRSGLMINILTDYLNGDIPIGLSAYTAEKSFLDKFWTSIAIENKKFGIEVINKYPKFMDTDFTQLSIEVRESLIDSGNFTDPLILSREIKNLIYGFQ